MPGWAKLGWSITLQLLPAHLKAHFFHTMPLETLLSYHPAAHQKVLFTPSIHGGDLLGEVLKCTCQGRMVSTLFPDYGPFFNSPGNIFLIPLIHV